MTSTPEPTATLASASPYVDMPRSAWSELAASTAVRLDPGMIEQLRGLGDPTSEQDVQEVYHPLAELIVEYVRNTGHLYRDSNQYLGLTAERTPFIVGIAGSVAVGKSTVARLVTELLRRTHGRPRVELVTTDGFLYPNSVLEKRGILDKKGFPESYDTAALLQFIIDVKSGMPEVRAPLYSHSLYDVVPGQFTVLECPDILVIEGINILQIPDPIPGKRASMLAVSDFFDFSVYVDAHEDDIRRWYISRFLKLRDSAFQDPDSFFRQYAALTDEQAIAFANEVWDATNGPNLVNNIEPTKVRATAILRKGPDHSVERVRIRKI
ncbi:MAG: type I pantothenate kinase [Propionibacteriaceae bacterium]|nr:type I pantothenate kinase [Propionibacteriaceae bacterium]